jgi:hypothetical protein
VQVKAELPVEIEEIKWSPDDAFIMLINYKKSQIHLRNTRNTAIEMNLEGWTAQIQDEMMVGAVWAADSRHILTFMDLQLRATVWSLIDQQVTAHIRGPKMVPPKGLDFSKNGKFLALLERKDRESKDQISIYYSHGDFKKINVFEIPDLFDA